MAAGEVAVDDGDDALGIVHLPVAQAVEGAFLAGDVVYREGALHCVEAGGFHFAVVVPLQLHLVCIDKVVEGAVEH